MEQILSKITNKYVPSLLKRPLRKCYQNSKSAYLALSKTLSRNLKRGKINKYTEGDLVSAFRSAGIEPGDSIMVHSSLSAIGQVIGGPQSVINALIAVVGANGTILMPTYGDPEEVQYQASKNKVVDLRTQASTSGIIPNTFLKVPGVYRSSHPIYSVTAIGCNAKILTSDHDKQMANCHTDSPLARLVTLGGKTLVIGSGLGHVSLYHVIEDTMDKFPVKVYAAPFKVKYIDFWGNQIERNVVRHDVEIARTRIDYNVWIRESLTNHLAQKKITKSFRVGDSEAWLIDGEKLILELRRLAEKGITIYLTKKQWKNMNHGDESIVSW